MTTNPELVLTLMFEAYGEPCFDIELDQFVQLLKFIPLPIQSENLLFRESDIGSI